MHVRFVNDDVMKANYWIHINSAGFRSLAHDLFMDLAIRRHVDDDITSQKRMATQPPARLQALASIVKVLRISLRRQAVGARRNRVLSEISFADDDLATSANTTAAANGVNVDTERARASQNRGL